MYCITEQQIEYILSDIRRNGVETEDLQLNLLDHICCIVEQGLEDEGDFEHFYSRTIRAFYKHELKEIEEETQLLLTFKNYYAMKKTMLITGAISTAAFIAGSLFKIMHWPGASVLLMLAIGLFSFLFLPLMFLLKSREAANLRDKAVFAIGTLAGTLYCVSMVFQLQQWPGKHEIWLATLALSFFVFLPLYFFSGIRKPEARMNTMVTTILLVAAIGIQFTLTTLRPVQKAEATPAMANTQPPASAAGEASLTTSSVK